MEDIKNILRLCGLSLSAHKTRYVLLAAPEGGGDAVIVTNLSAEAAQKILTEASKLYVHSQPV